MAKPWELDYDTDERTQPAGQARKPWELDYDGEEQPSEDKRGFLTKSAEAVGDFALRAGGAVVSGLASVPLGVEQGVKALVRQSVEGGSDTMVPAGIYNPAIDTDEALRGPETTAEKDARFLAGQRAASGVPELPGARALADVGRGAREGINALTSEDTQRAVAGSQITGNIFKGEIDFGDDPSVRGYVMQAADVFGSMLPVVATAMATRSPGAGGAVGGAMAAGEGAEAASRFLASKTDAELQQESPYFARLVSGGATPEEARQLTLDKASESAALLQGLVASVGDRFTGKLVTGGLDPLLAKVAGKSVLGKAAAGTALSGLEEGAQEVGEGVASDLGVASAVPTKEIGEDSAANLVLGAIGGGPVGGARGAYSGLVDRAGAAPAPSAPPTPPVPRETPPPAGQAGAGDAQTAVGTADTQEAERALLELVSDTDLGRVEQIETEQARLAERLAELTPENGYGPAFEPEREQVAQQLEALRAEQQILAQSWPKALSGAPASFSTEAGVRLQGEYALMDADDIITSHDTNLREEPRFPRELQPRDRTRAASELQVSSITQRLDPARLGASADAATGAPIIGRDGLVESGNARTIALKRVYEANGLKADEYRAFLRDNAAQFGLDPAAIDGMAKPVLVRVRRTPVNRAEFARQANAATVQRMAPAEQALADARRLTSLEGLQPDENGEFDNSRDFIRQFMATLPVTEQSGMLESDGRLSTEGYRRIQNAVLAKAYGDSPTLRRMTESRDDNLRNISKALLRAAPTIAEARDRIAAGVLNDADVTPELLAAVEGLSALKERGWSVDEELGQRDLAGPRYSEEAAMLLRFLADNIRAPRRIAEFLQRYYEALDAEGNPNQASMFDDAREAPTVGGLLRTAQGEADGDTSTNPERRDDRAAARGAATPGQEPQDATRDQGGTGGDGRAQGGAEPDQQPPGQERGAQRAKGRAVSEGWAFFPPDSGTLGIPRADMPQVKMEHRGAFVQFLESRGVAHSAEIDVDPNSLKPTQADFQQSKVDSFAKGGPPTRAVLVSADGYLLDGHHQWLGAKQAGRPVRVIRFEAPIRELIEIAHDFPSTQLGAGSARRTRAKDQTTAMIDGRPYEPERDNYVSAPVAEVFPGELVKRIDGYVERFYTQAAPYQMSDTERLMAEELLQPFINRAKDAKVEYDQKIIDIAQRTKALGQQLAPIKSIKRAAEKMHQEAVAQNRGMQASDVKDLLRSTIVVEVYGDAIEVLDAIAEEFNVVRVKDRTDQASRDKNGGYADYLVNVKMPNGVIAEIQINVPPMLSAKAEQGHKLYEAARDLSGQPQMQAEINSAMRELYDFAFSAAEGRGITPVRANSRALAAQEMNAASDSGAPVRGPSSGMPGSGMSLAPSSDILNQPEPGNRTKSSEKSVTKSEPSGNESGNFIADTSASSVPATSADGNTRLSINEERALQQKIARHIRLSAAGATTKASTPTVAELRELASTIRGKLQGLPEVVVLAGPEQAPAALREFIASRGAMGTVEGAMHDGKIYLFASGLTDMARAEHVLAEHEATHYGLRGLLGDDLAPTMRRFYKDNGRLQARVDALRRRRKGLSIEEAVEEVLVDMPTRELARMAGWRRVVQAVQKWLAARGFERLAAKLDELLQGTITQQKRADLMAADLVRAARAYVATKRPLSETLKAETRLESGQQMLADDLRRQEEWLQREARERGFKDIEELLAADYALFERLAARWREMNPAQQMLSTAKDARERADDIIAKPAATAKPLDALAQAVTRYSGIQKIMSAIYDRGAYLFDRFTPEIVKAGVVSDYGVPQSVIDQRVMLQGRQRVQLRKAGQLIEKLATLTRAESRVAYEWMNMDGSNPQAYLSAMQGLPEESVLVLQDVQKMIDDLSREAVRLGQLSPEAFKRNRFAYLRRSYAKHILEQGQVEKAKRSRVISILGEQYRGRGLSEQATMDKMRAVAPEWWGRKLKAGKADAQLKGEKFIRLELRTPRGAGTKTIEGVEASDPAGRVREIVYWPEGEKLPPRFKDWTQAGVFEVRDVKGPKVVLWRDFTKDEREKMGEIDEARFAIAKTLHAMIHDIEVGRYLEWMAHSQAKKEGETIPGQVVEASEAFHRAFKPGEWVRVPDSKITGTDVHRYGKLAGRYVPGPVWNDIRQVVGGQFRPFGETYGALLSYWKTAKTALSPAVHMNNVMSNFVMADWHNVTAGHVAKALRIVLAASKGENQGLLAGAGKAAAKTAGIADREAAREILARYQDSGGDIGSWVTNEIQTDQIEPLLAALEKEMAEQGPTDQVATGVFTALQHALMLRFPSAWAAFKPTLPGRVISNEAKALIDLYQHEDDVFRLAAWLRAKEDGVSDVEAGRAARQSFLDYSINAPWIAAMRASAWPFISFTYRAVPMLLEIAGKRPHKLLKLMAIAGGLNALGSMIAGGDDDEEEQARRLLPEEKAGKVWGMVPKLIRMPWNDQHGSPVYLDIRRWIPVGDVFDVGQGQAAIPMLPGLMPGGPLVIVGEVVFNKSAFTGKNITQETDTGTEQATKVADHLWKAFMPNVLGLPGTYATEGVLGSLTGRTDAFGREFSPAQATASAFGVKIGSYPTDVLKRNQVARARALESEVDKNIAQLKRQRQTGRITTEEFREKVDGELAKKAKINRDLVEKLQGPAPD